MTQYNGSHEVMGPHTPGRIDDAGTLQMAGSGHTHVEADITDLQSYSLTGHTHVEADITDLQSYSLTGHTHVEADITDLGNYSVVGHTHTESDVTDLDAYLPKDGSEFIDAVVVNDFTVRQTTKAKMRQGFGRTKIRNRL